MPKITRMVTARVPTSFGNLRLSLYRNGNDDKEHLALVRGSVSGRSNVLVRIHSECFTGDVLASERCDCGDQLGQALILIGQEDCGVVVYLRQEGRGIGLLEKLKAYNLQDLGYDTVDANHLLGHAADQRDYALAAHILEDLEVRSVRLLTNNPDKVEGLVDNGVEVCGRVPILGPVKAENAVYLRTKVERLRHQLELDTGLDNASAPAAAAAGPRLLFGDVVLPGPPEDRTRPLVTLSYAQSLDGCIAAEAARPLAISGPESLGLTHELRASHDGILVGIGTVLADDPRLTARLEGARDPQPVILDSRLRFPLKARMLATSRPWIAADKDADPRRQAALEEVGAQVLRLPSDEPGRISLKHLLEELHRRGISSLMVEGGAEVISSFLASRCIDHLVLTVAPTMIGGLAAVDRRPDGRRPALPRLQGTRYQQMGEDLVLWGKPEWPSTDT